MSSFEIHSQQFGDIREIIVLYLVSVPNVKNEKK